MYDLGVERSLYGDFANLESIHTIKKMLDKNGYQSVLLGNTKQIAQMLINGGFNCDLVYNTVEGIKSRNREGLLPALFEIHNIPYIGTDAFGLSLSLDKTLTKMLAERMGILTPKYFSVSPGYSTDALREQLSCVDMPVIIKPNFEGNSSGICVAKTLDQATERIMDTLQKYRTSVLCEEFIYGTEITVPMIGNDLANMIWGATYVDIQRNDEFWFDAEAKNLSDYRNIILETTDTIRDEFKRVSTIMFVEIGCHDFARFDYRLTKDGKIYFIEVNPLPSLFPGGAFDVVCQSYGYSFVETIRLIVETACNRLSIPKSGIPPKIFDAH
jgi:D-alanine-D-alanine ligase